VQEVSEEREGVSQELSGTFSGSHRCHDRDLCFRGITPNRVGIKKKIFKVNFTLCLVVFVKDAEICG
jgi:hypothetical protein